MPACGDDGGPSTSGDVATDAATGADADPLDDVLSGDAVASDAGPSDDSDDGSASGLALPFPDGFRFGASTAAHQVEGGLHNTWTEWERLPQFEELTDERSGPGVAHADRYEEDLDHVADMGLDVFRLSIEWSRIEPEQGSWSDDGIAHYDAVFDAMEERGVRPSVTLHHFTEPAWFLNLEELLPPFDANFCVGGPSDDDFCGWSNPAAPAAFGAYCGKVAEAFGDRVDEWMTINEPIGYWLGGHLAGDFPPGLKAADLADAQDVALPALRHLLAGHVACYEAIHANDTVDADGDGEAARVGLTMGAGALQPARPEEADDVAATEQAEFLANYLAFDAVIDGLLDADLDGVPEEEHPEWAGTVDLIGVQYYAGGYVVGVSVHPLLLGTPCIGTGAPGASELAVQLGCPGPPEHAEYPFDDGDGVIVGRLHMPTGLRAVVEGYHARYGGIPQVVTEHGFANDSSRRAGSLVRHLAVAHEIVEAGLPLEGYYHWSLLDNFEWGSGYDVRFGLIGVDRADDMRRVPGVAADVYKEIATARGISQDLLELWGGDGPLPTDPAPPAEPRPVLQAIATAPVSSVLPDDVVSCAVLRETTCVDGAELECAIYDGAAGDWAEDVSPMTEQAFVFDRYHDLYHEFDGQTVDIEFTEQVLPGTPEEEWSKPEYIERMNAYGDSSGWTGTAAWSAAARYAATGTEADYERMLSKLENTTFFYEVTGIPGMMARSHFGLLEEGAPLPHGHWGKALAPWYPETGGGWHFHYEIADELLDRLPSHYTEGIEIGGEHWDTIPRWQGDASRDMYVRSLPGIMLGYDLLGEGEREDHVRDVVRAELPCTLNRLKKGRISNLQDSPELLEGVTAFLAGANMSLDEGDIDFKTLDEIIVYVMEQPNPAHPELFDSACPDGPPTEIDPALDMDVNAADFLPKLLDFVARLDKTHERPIVWPMIVSVRASDLLYMTQWGLTAHYLTGDSRYLDWVDTLREEVMYEGVLDTFGAFVLPAWCQSHYAPSLAYPTLYNLLARIDRLEHRGFWEMVSQVAVNEGRHKEMAGRDDAFWGVLYHRMTDIVTDSSGAEYIAGLVDVLRGYGMNPDDKLDPDRNYPRDWIDDPLVEQVPLDDASRAVCETPVELLGTVIDEGGVGDEEPRALNALPLSMRTGGGFVWTGDPWRLRYQPGSWGFRTQFPMLGMTAPYWIGRADGVIEEGQGMALGWRATGTACDE